MEQGRPGGVERLQKAIVEETLQPLTKALCRSAGVEAERILRCCVASNTTMNHLLLGVDADPVRMEVWLGVRKSPFLFGRPPLVGREGLKIETLTVNVVGVGRVHYALKACFHGKEKMRFRFLLL